MLAKTEKNIRQHFTALGGAFREFELLNGGPPRADQIANLDEKPLKPSETVPRRVVGPRKNGRHPEPTHAVASKAPSFTTVETVFADGTSLPTIYVFKGNRVPENYNHGDPGTSYFMTKEGGVDAETWDNKIVPALLKVYLSFETILNRKSTRSTFFKYPFPFLVQSEI